MQKLFVTLLTSACFTIMACTPQSKTTSDLTSEDINKIRSINKSYVNGWLKNDTTAILDLFSENATIIPSGLTPKSGRNELAEFWFPDDSSETVVHKYEIEILELEGAQNFAYTLEKGFLQFSYKKGDFSITKESNAFAMTVYEKKYNGEWKIVSRIWTDMK